jgi:hypothetical protein
MQQCSNAWAGRRDKWKEQFFFLRHAAARARAHALLGTRIKCRRA